MVNSSFSSFFVYPFVKKGVNAVIKNKDERTNKNGSSRHPALQALAVTTTIGTELGITTALGFYLGRFIDGKLDTTPLFLIIFLLLGLGIGVFGIINTLNAFFKDKGSSENKDNKDVK